MPWHSDSIPILSQATRTSSGTSNGYPVGSYEKGELWIYVPSMSGTNPRLTPSWQQTYRNYAGTAGSYLTMRSFATSIKATGLSVITLPSLGHWGRVSYAIAGTGANVKFEAWLVGKGF